MSVDDQSIWAKFISGDDEAYAYIYRQHIQKLFLFGMTFTSDEEQVKDCIQDVFVKIYNNKKRLGQTDNIWLYLTAALKNTLFNAFKKQNSYRNIISSISMEDIDNDTAIEKLILKEKEIEQKEIVTICKSVLTQRQQEIIYYKFVEGLSLTEISDRLNIDYHSVANIIQRAFKKIRLFYLKSD